MKLRALLWLATFSLLIGLEAGRQVSGSLLPGRSATAAMLEVPESFEEPVMPEETSSEEPIPEQTEPRPYAPLRSPITCPADIETLSALMMRDLPNYTNRVLQRTVAVLPWTEADELRQANGEFVRSPYRPSHVLVAGQVDLTPLDLNEYAFTTSPEAGGPLTQMFFTTLSRHYSGLQADEVQEYHWLFLTQTPEGWRLAFMFSSVDDANDSRAPLPPTESSSSSVGQAVQIWLRDCRAGAIDAIEPS